MLKTQTLFEMMKDRQYKLKEDKKIKEVKFLFEHTFNKDICPVFYWIENISKDKMIQCISFVNNLCKKAKKKIKNVILISDRKFTTFAQTERAKEHKKNNSIRYRFFNSSFFHKNITHHQAYSKHVKQTDLDILDSLKKKYGKHKPPCIDVNDPVCRYFNFNLEDTIFIYRRWGGSCPPVVYVRVVKDLFNKHYQ